MIAIKIISFACSKVALLLSASSIAFANGDIQSRWRYTVIKNGCFKVSRQNCLLRASGFVVQALHHHQKLNESLQSAQAVHIAAIGL